MPIESARKYHATFRLRTILLIVALFVLILPLGGLFFFRIYENELLRQTEMELISQGAALTSAYKAQLRPLLTPRDTLHYGRPLPEGFSRHTVDAYYTPLYPQLDLARNPTLPPRPDPLEVTAPIDPYAAVAGKAMHAIIAETQQTTLAGIVLLDHKGLGVTGPDAGKSFTQAREVQLALQGQYASSIRERDMDFEPPALASISRGTGIRVFAALPIIEGERLWGVIYLSRTPQNILKHLYAERDKVLLAGVTVLGITLFLAFFVAYTVARPIHRLIDKTRRVAEGDAAAMGLLRRPGTKEVELLSRSFSKMAHALHARTEYIREFATHMSHEFKTPLTGIQGATELLIEHGDDMEEKRRRKFLGNIMQDTERLKRLVSRLLELARADNITPTGESCYIMPILTRLAEQSSGDGFRVQVLGEGHYDALLPADSFESVITNLLENARQHGAEEVAIDLHMDEDILTIRLANNGAPISEANAARIFEPFFTTRREQGGTGLGLGIARSLLEAYGGSLEYVPTAQGVGFELKLPVLP